MTFPIRAAMLGLTLLGGALAAGPTLAEGKGHDGGKMGAPGHHRAGLTGGKITVSGQGEVHLAPDMATVTLGVTSEGKTAAEAMSENSAQLTKVLAALKAAGVAEADVQTSGLSLGPRWSGGDQGKPAQITGFEASNTVTARIMDLAKLGAVLDSVVESGANTFSGLSFGLKDDAKAQDEARAAAVKDAMAKAKLFAGAAGLRLGPVRTITEEGGGGAPMPMMKTFARAAAPVPVASGEVTVTSSVSMVFGLEE